MTKVINLMMGTPIVSALNRLGQAYQHLTFSILNAPLPKGLTPEQSKQVQTLLQDKVAPFKANAVTSYKKALEKGEGLNTYNNEYLNTLYELSKIDSSFASYKVPYLSDGKTVQYGASVGSRFPGLVTSMSKSEDQVLEEASAALGENPKSAKALFMLANYYHKKRFSGVSDIFLDKMENPEKGKADTLNLRALNQLLDNNRRGAVKDLKAALKSEPSHVVSAINLSSLYSKYGGYKSSYDVLREKAASIKVPETAKHIVLNNYALGMIANGKIDEACGRIENCIACKGKLFTTVGNLAILTTVVQKNKIQSNQYLSQYKRLAKAPVDLDRIKIMEKIQL